MPRTNEATAKRKSELIRILQESPNEIKFTELKSEKVDKCIKKIEVRDDEEDAMNAQPNFKEEKNIAFCTHSNCTKNGLEFQVQYIS